MSRLDDAFRRVGKASLPGESVWQSGWDEKLKEINEKAESLVQCDVPDCYVCLMEYWS